MDEPAVELRARTLERLAAERFDLLVVGGGILGAGIAEAASAHGLAVALVDRGDFGGGTSSASSKLVHGGLRYLRLGDVRLVREALQERRTLMRVVAPHLVRRQPFLFPLYRGGPYGPATIQAGILLYQLLARARLHRLVRPRAARELVPSLRVDGLRACGLYADAVTHDARLTLENVLAASERGAAVLNYAEVVALRTETGRVAGAELEADGDRVAVRARAVVNAAGPWVDEVRRLEDERARPSVRLSKGVHVLVDLGEPWQAALAVPQDPVRVTFAVPWEGMLLLGTTDTLNDGSPDNVRVDDADVAQVLAEASAALDRPLAATDVRHAFAGLRVLPGTGADTSRARRETVFSRGRGGMLSVAGGKLTTYRRIALDALAHLSRELDLRLLDRSPRPLPGAAAAADARLPSDLDATTRAHLLHLYGGLAEQVLAPAADDPALLEPLVPGRPDVAAQVVYAVRHEWARTEDDVLYRRTTAGVGGAADARERVSALLGGRAQPARGGVM